MSGKLQDRIPCFPDYAGDFEELQTKQNVIWKLTVAEEILGRNENDDFSFFVRTCQPVSRSAVTGRYHKQKWRYRSWCDELLMIRLHDPAFNTRAPSSRSGRTSSRRRGSPPPGPPASRTPPPGSLSRWSPAAWSCRPRSGCCCWWGTGSPPPCRRWWRSPAWWREAGWSSLCRWRTRHLNIQNTTTTSV